MARSLTVCGICVVDTNELWETDTPGHLLMNYTWKCTFLVIFQIFYSLTFLLLTFNGMRNS